MARPKNVIWECFGEPYAPPPLDDGVLSTKSKYCRCSACDEPIIAATARMRDHWAKCKKRPRSIGQLDCGFQPESRQRKRLAHGSSNSWSQQESPHTANSWSQLTAASSSQAGLGAYSPTGDTVNSGADSSSLFSGGREHFDHLKPGENEKLNVLFARAIHRTATPFSAFDDPAWKAFFQALRGCYKLPSRDAIGGSLMRSEYVETMNEVLFALSRHPLICFTLDGATDVLGKQIINMMACVPKAYFLEHFTMELRRESAANLLGNLLDCKLRLLRSIRQAVPGYSLLINDHNNHTAPPATGIVLPVGTENEGNDQAIGNQLVQELLPCLRNEHFVNPPMFTFCSDSPSVMMKLRRDCLTSNEFVFAYGCAPHAINNLCMDLIKLFPGVKVVLKQILFMVKTLKSSHLLQQLFDKLCVEKYKKTYVLILFTKTRWGTVFYSAQRATLVKSACAALPGEIMNSDLDIDISDKFKQLVTDPAYWKGVAAMEALFRTIASCLTYLEGDEATFSAVYASFIAIKYHLRKLDGATKDGLSLGDNDVERMMSLTHHRLSTIYTEAHTLAFATDPMFIGMRTRIAAEFGEDFLQLGKPPINQQSKVALSRLANGNDDLRRRMYSEFATFIRSCKDDTVTCENFEDIKMKPSELWTLCDDCDYGAIKHLLSAVHQNPTGASGGERNHKSAKHVHSKLRARLGQGKVERGTAIHFNAKQLQRKMKVTRDSNFCMWLKNLGSNILVDALAPVPEVVDNPILVGGSNEAELLAADEDEFNRIDFSGGIDTIADDELFVDDALDAVADTSSTDVALAAPVPL